MKILLDENISYRIMPLLSDSFQPCTHAKVVSPSLKTDKAIWHYARKHHFTIVSFDSDFYGWQLLNGFPPKIIWLRCGNVTTRTLAHKLNAHEKLLLKFFHDKKEGVIEIF